MADRSWPDDWTERMAGWSCPMCATVGYGDNDYGVHVFTGEFAEVSLQRRTRLPGYCVVVWRHGHVAASGRAALDFLHLMSSCSCHGERSATSPA